MLSAVAPDRKLLWATCGSTAVVAFPLAAAVVANVIAPGLALTPIWALLKVMGNCDKGISLPSAVTTRALAQKRVAGLVAPRHGQILFNGTRVDQLPAHRMARQVA